MSSTSSNSSNSSSNSNNSNNIRRNAVRYLANIGNNTPVRKSTKKGTLSSKGKINIGKYFLFSLIILAILALVLYFLHLSQVVHIPFFEKDENKE